MRIENFAYIAEPFDYAEESGVSFSIKNPIPVSILEEIVNYFSEDVSKESIVQIWYDEKGYKVVKPCVQKVSKVSVEYSFSLETRGECICTIHSHNTMPAYFSPIDDADELSIPGLYGVIGSLAEEAGEILFTSAFRYCYPDCEPITMSIDEIFDIGGEDYE